MKDTTTIALLNVTGSYNRENSIFVRLAKVRPEARSMTNRKALSCRSALAFLPRPKDGRPWEWLGCF